MYFFIIFIIIGILLYVNESNRNLQPYDTASGSMRKHNFGTKSELLFSFFIKIYIILLTKQWDKKVGTNISFRSDSSQTVLSGFRSILIKICHQQIMFHINYFNW